LQDPRVVLKYTTEVQRLLETYQVTDRLDKIQLAFLSGDTEDAIAMYEEVDKIRTQAILTADKKCQRLRMSNIPFSPTLLENWKKILAWRLLIQKLEGCKVDSKYLARKLKQAGIRDYYHLTLSVAKECLDTTITNYSFEKKNALVSILLHASIEAYASIEDKFRPYIKYSKIRFFV
jgi:hypothetical protein